MQNYLAKASVLVYLKLQASRNHCTGLLSNCVNTDVSQTKSMPKTSRKAEILQKLPSNILIVTVAQTTSMVELLHKKV